MGAAQSDQPPPPVTHVGHGQYAVVRELVGDAVQYKYYQAEDMLDQRMVLVKRASRFWCRPHTLLRERDILARLRGHAGIVEVLAYGSEAQREYIVFPWCRTLRELLEKREPLVEDVVKREVSSALAWMHARNMVHCDVKPENINERMQLCGMDSVYYDGTYGDGRGTATFWPPETFSDAVPTPARDAWALACTLWAVRNQDWRGPFGSFHRATLAELKAAVCDGPLPDGLERNPEKR